MSKSSTSEVPTSMSVIDWLANQFDLNESILILSEKESAYLETQLSDFTYEYIKLNQASELFNNLLQNAIKVSYTELDLEASPKVVCLTYSIKNQTSNAYKEYSICILTQQVPELAQIFRERNAKYQNNSYKPTSVGNLRDLIEPLGTCLVKMTSDPWDTNNFIWLSGMIYFNRDDIWKVLINTQSPNKGIKYMGQHNKGDSLSINRDVSWGTHIHMTLFGDPVKPIVTKLGQDPINYRPSDDTLLKQLAEISGQTVELNQSDT